MVDWQSGLSHRFAKPEMETSTGSNPVSTARMGSPLQEIKVNKMTVTREDVLKYLEEATLFEVSDLIDDIKERFSITEPAPVLIQETVEVEEKEEQTEFDVVLIGVGQFRIKVIKEIRLITGRGLKESKAITDSIPETILNKVTLMRAEETKLKLEAVGAEIEIK